LEPPNADDHYSEKLARLDNLPTYYYRPKLSTKENRTRSYFKLPEDKHLYLCPQTLFKFHPEFDSLLDDILKRDPLGEIVVIKQRPSYYASLLMKRWQKNIPQAAGRIRFIPQLSGKDFLALLRVCDVMLDSIHFGGGNTNYEGFAMGIPIVTMRGEFMRSRVAYACYRQMGITDCVANNRNEYVDIAVRLGTDRDFRKKVCDAIASRCDVLFENSGAVEELGSFLQSAYNRALRENN
jgi:predicted O-linked N-acetylglucosamine transferase (SPINDLY family)